MSLINHIFAWSYVGVYICVYSLFLIYNLHQFRSRQSHIIYTMRFSHITILQAAIFLFKLWVDAAKGMTFMYSLYDDASLTDRLFIVFNAYIASFFLYCFVWKFWLLRFNILLHSSLIDSEWKSVLNSSKYTHRNSFYVKYRRTLGKPQFTMFIFILFAVASCTPFVLITLVLDWGHDSHWFFEFEIDYVLPLILLIFLHLSTPSFEDNFYIRQEMKYVFICLVVMYVSYYCALSMKTQMNLDDDTEIVVRFATDQITEAAQFVAMMISTVWVNRRCERIIEMKRFEEHKINRKSMFHEGFAIQIVPKSKKVNGKIESAAKKQKFDVEMSNISTSNPNAGECDHELKRHSSSKLQAPIRLSAEDKLQSMKKTALKEQVSLERVDSLKVGMIIDGFHGVVESTSVEIKAKSTDTLQSVLADDRLLDLFAKHLVREFCIECLLSVIEMQQWKQHLIDALGIERFGQIVGLAPGAPRSELVYKDKDPDLRSFKKMAFEIYRRYIMEGSEFEINISYKLRKELARQLADYDKWMESTIAADELSWIFDDCLAQNIKLLKQSKERFHGNLDRMSM